MQIDPSHAARDRRRKGKDVVHARLPLVVDRHNKRGAARLERRGEARFAKGESHGMSAFFRIDDDVFHTYSTFARGCESLTDSFSLLDITAYGRQEEFEDSPAGWPQRPTYG